MLGTIADLVPLGYLAIGFSPRLLRMSENCAEILSWGSVAPKPFRAMDLLGLKIVDRAKHLKNVRAALDRGDDKVILSILMVRPNGYKRQLRVSLRPTRDKGAITGCFVALVDDTEQRRSEAELRSTWSTVPNAMIVIDAGGIIRAFSAAAESMFGYKADRVIGKRIEILMPEPYRSQHDSYLERYVETGKAHIIGQSRIMNAIRADGSEFPIELWVGDASTESERLFTGFIRDHSDRFETEAKLQSLQNDLVHVARLSAMSELSLSLAHELNQPLAAIANYLATAEFLAAQPGIPDADKLEAAMKHAGEQAMRAGEIVKRLRTFVEKGEADMRVEPVGPIIRDATSLIALSLRRKGIALEISIHDENEVVLGDNIQLQQVLFNLMRNAVEALEASGENKPRMKIATQRKGQSVEIDVIDNGPGIPRELAEKLFRPFSSHKASGMGVGLSISRRILEAHGGMLTYSPSPGGGACFTLTLPVAIGGDDG